VQHLSRFLRRTAIVAVLTVGIMPFAGTAILCIMDGALRIARPGDSTELSTTFVILVALPLATVFGVFDALSFIKRHW
jgi:hypothetical protein